MNKQKLKDYYLPRVDSLVETGKGIAAKPWSPRGNYIGGAPQYVDLQQFRKWSCDCNALMHSLGTAAKPWDALLGSQTSNDYGIAVGMVGALESLRDAIASDFLVRVEDLVFADALADLLDQADQLLEKKYVLAAAVILRAVLEERLKLLCDRNGCMPEIDRPTIADYRVALAKAQVIDRITAANVEAMTATGNHAAHNKPDLQRDDVVRFRRDLGEFLVKFSA